MRMHDTEFKQHYVFGNSDTGGRTGQRGLEESAGELRLTVSCRFLENAVRVGARCRPADLEPRRGCGKSISADDFPKDACLGGRQPKSCAKPPDLGAKTGAGIDDEDSSGRPLNVEDRHRAVRGERDDMGDKRRPIFAAPQLKRAADIAVGSIRLRPLSPSAHRRAVSAGLVAASRPCSYRKPIPRRMRSSALALAKTTRQSQVKRKTAKPASATAAPSEPVVALVRERRSWIAAARCKCGPSFSKSFHCSGSSEIEAGDL